MTRRSILLVEDNPDDEALALRALSRNNLAVMVSVVRDGAEAIDYLFGTGPYASRGAIDPPTVVFLDIDLPKVNGLEVLRRLRAEEHTRCIPVVLFSSSREERDVLTGYQLGANSFVTKPVDYENYIETIWNLGSYWLKLNEPMPSIGRN